MHYSSVQEVTQQVDQKTCSDSNTTNFYLGVVLIPKLNIYSVNSLITGWRNTGTTTHKHKQPSLLLLGGIKLEQDAMVST